MTVDSMERVQELTRKVSTLKGEISTKRFEADSLVAEYAAKGVNPTIDKAAMAAVDAAYKQAAPFEEELATLEAERDKLVIALGASGNVRGVQVLEDGSVLGAAPWTLTRDGLDELHALWQSGRFGRAGVRAVSDIGGPDPTSIERSGILVSIQQEPTRIANYIPVRQTASSRVEYTQQTSQADGFESVAQGAAKPQVSPSWERKFADIVKVAAWGRLDDELLKDIAEFRSMVGAAFLRGLVSEENRQLLTADGTGEDMFGLLNTDGILSVFRDVTTPEHRVETIHRGITRLRTGPGFAEPTQIILHPVDYEEAIFEKTSGSGEYIAGDPLEADSPSLWGVPVLLTTDMTQGTGIVANLPGCGRIHWRESPIFEVHPGGGGQTEWAENKTLVRAEERLVLTVEHPEMIVEVDLL